MRPDPDEKEYYAAFERNYEKLNYANNLASKVLRKSHAVLEAAYDEKDHFSQVLEIGAGSGLHYAYIKHRFDHYIMSDGHDGMLALASKKVAGDPRFQVQNENAAKLSFKDHSFDRVIATHVLEHMPSPHLVLREWHRLVKPGGVLSLVLPCDPGFAWRFGRNIGVRKRAKDAGLEYDYWMAREHINAIFNLTTLLEYYFDNRQETWWPCRVPFADVNLIYAVNIRV